MTRIVAGFAASLALNVPKNGTRPTSDRVKEALFSALDARKLIENSRVLDLFAGSAALGLEAASRNAASVTLVESDKNAAQICRINAAKILASHVASHAKIPRNELSITVSHSTVARFLTHNTDTFDLVFCDPPYDRDENTIALELAKLLPRLSTHATVIVERGHRSTTPQWPPGMETHRSTKYGDTTLWWGRRSQS